MLFNSPEFILLFLPITLILFVVLKKNGLGRLTIAWLALSSLFFYGCWDARYLLLLLGSVVVNFSIGSLLASGQRKIWLWCGIAANLSLIGWYKYTDFFITTSNELFATSYQLMQIVLPLGISFFTFQQIAYLVDSWRGEVREHNFLHYLTFVTFFPQLIAGPIVHHKMVMQQFIDNESAPYDLNKTAAGISLFAIGLFKKVVLADGLASYASPVFATAKDGNSVAFLDAWGAALGYTFQLYFDFSGYSDMAIGLGLMFGIILPINFNSPYKAASIIEFWRRWHMTLSAFLRDYVYVPLGGSRLGRNRRYINLMLTMLIGGLWHGAGWTFVLWGGLHGVYLVINHLWRMWFSSSQLTQQAPSLSKRIMAHVLTLLAVVVAWVLFRAENLSIASQIYQGMLGMNGLILPSRYVDSWSLFAGYVDWISFSDSKAVGALRSLGIYTLLAISMLIAFCFPNCSQLFSHLTQSDSKRFYSWSGNKVWIAITIVALTTPVYLVVYSSDRISEFIYFQF